MESRPKPKHLPWRSWAEWKSAYTALRSAPQTAIGVVRVWQLRKSLPVRVELTLNIIILRQDQGLDTGALTETEKAAFGLCVLRGVNLLTGLEQKAKNAMSILGLAKEIGLPEYLVDLRHNIAHGSMPPAELLQTAVEALWT
jgi:ribosomal biogenesis protein LAS1